MLLRGRQFHDSQRRKRSIPGPGSSPVHRPRLGRPFRSCLTVDLTVGAPRPPFEAACRAPSRSHFEPCGRRFRPAVRRRARACPRALRPVLHSDLVARLAGNATANRVVLLVTRSLPRCSATPRWTGPRLRGHRFSRGHHHRGPPHQRYSPLRVVREVLEHEPDLVVVVNTSAAISRKRCRRASVRRLVRTSCRTREPRNRRVARAARFRLAVRRTTIKNNVVFPEKQLIQARCLTYPTRAAPPLAAPEHDLVYLSHASKSRQQILDVRSTGSKLTARPRDRRTADTTPRRTLRHGAKPSRPARVRGRTGAGSRRMEATHRLLEDGAPWVEIQGASSIFRYDQPLYRAASWLHRQQGLRWSRNRR